MNTLVCPITFSSSARLLTSGAASLIADFLVSRIPESDSGDAFEGLSAALAKLPDLQEGMNINSVWSDHSSFRQLGEGGELKVFELCGVELVHGWLAGELT